MRTPRIPRHIRSLRHSALPTAERTAVINEQYRKLRKEGNPLVSVVIPAYNEEENILPLLHSLVLNRSNYPVEILVVNNNSKDSTEELVRACGVPCIRETIQGITAARNAGLRAANGKYVLNADADSIYSTNWIDSLVGPMEKDSGIAVTYGIYAFIPTGRTGRVFYFFYEYLAGVRRLYKRKFGEPAVNVFGCSSAYRREEGLSVEGYNHPKGANEDGYLALKLRNAGYGRLHFVSSFKTLVWTPDGRIQAEGGMRKGIGIRLRKFFFSKSYVQLRTDL